MYVKKLYTYIDLVFITYFVIVYELLFFNRWCGDANQWLKALWMSCIWLLMTTVIWYGTLLTKFKMFIHLNKTDYIVHPVSDLLIVSLCTSLHKYFVNFMCISYH